jgi:hypothetical protein
MFGRRFVLALSCALFGASSACGQEPVDTTDPDELRELIDRLESQLSTIQQDRNKRNRVTDLGYGSSQIFSDEPRLVLRIYDLSDLFSFAPPYPATQGNTLGSNDPLFPQLPAGEGGATFGGMGGMGGGGFFRVGDEPATERPTTIPPERPFAAQLGRAGGVVTTTRTSMDGLIDAVTSTIEPTQWDDAGGPCSISPLGTSLLVSATSSIHRQIEGLFGAFRERWGTLRTVTVQADWIWLSRQELVQAVQRQPSSAGPGDVPSFGLIDDKAWNELMLKEDRRAGYTATMTCTNGQTVNTVSGRQSVVVNGVTPVVGGEKEEVGYRASAMPLQEGAAIQITPVVSTSGKFVILDVHTRVVEPQHDPAEQPPAAQGKAAKGKHAAIAAAEALDRPQLAAYRFATTVRLPVDRRVLVGGMTYQTDAEDGSSGMYLAVKTSIQELRDDDEEDGVLETEASEPKQAEPKPE